MKNKPDDRRDNVEKIQSNIDHTMRNMEMAEDMAADTPDSKTKRALLDKNERRREALEGMRREIKDEAKAREKNNNR